jgi:hypothetical protein
VIVVVIVVVVVVVVVFEYKMRPRAAGGCDYDGRLVTKENGGAQGVWA